MLHAHTCMHVHIYHTPRTHTTATTMCIHTTTVCIHMHIHIPSLSHAHTYHTCTHHHYYMPPHTHQHYAHTATICTHTHNIHTSTHTHCVHTHTHIPLPVPGIFSLLLKSDSEAFFANSDSYQPAEDPCSEWPRSGLWSEHTQRLGCLLPCS